MVRHHYYSDCPAASHDRSRYVKGLHTELIIEIDVADINAADTVVIGSPPPLLTAIAVMTGLFRGAYYSPFFICNQYYIVNTPLSACAEIFQIIGCPVIQHLKEIGINACAADPPGIYFLYPLLNFLVCLAFI